MALTYCLKEMKVKKEILAHFNHWIKKNKNIRAAILTSSRANPKAKTDFLSDYDIELYVVDLSPFEKNDDWLKPFGPIMTRWPYKPRTTFSGDWLTRLILFRDGNRIDFQITDNFTAVTGNTDSGYKILIDEDNILPDLIPAPTHAKYITQKPTKEKYETLINEFWWNTTYVPKYLWRDQLPFAKTMLGQSMQDKYLRQIIKWYIGLKSNWSVNTGNCGKYFKQYLDLELWSAYESTYCGAGIKENWDAFYKAVNLFCKLARELGEALDYEYPHETEKSMLTYYKKIQNTKKEE